MAREPVEIPLWQQHIAAGRDGFAEHPKSAHVQ